MIMHYQELIRVVGGKGAKLSLGSNFLQYSPGDVGVLLPCQNTGRWTDLLCPQVSHERRLSSVIANPEADDDGFDKLLASIGFGRWQMMSVVMVLIRECSHLHFVVVSLYVFNNFLSLRLRCLFA